MNAWERRNQAFVWTELGAQAYRLLSFNQNESGVFLNYDSYHHSIHASGFAHTRSNPKTTGEWSELPYRVPPLKELQSRFIGGHWLSLAPESIRSFGVPVSRPASHSQAILLDATDFPTFSQPVVEVAIYDPLLRDDWKQWLQRSLAERPTLEHLLWREYWLDNFRKFLGVFVFRADHPELRRANLIEDRQHNSVR